MPAMPRRSDVGSLTMAERMWSCVCGEKMRHQTLQAFAADFFVGGEDEGEVVVSRGGGVEGGEEAG